MVERSYPNRVATLKAGVRTRSVCCTDHGATMVEFALVFGVVLLLIVGIIDFSRYALALNTTSHAARRILDRAKTTPALLADIRGQVETPATQRFVSARSALLDEALRSVALDPAGSTGLAEFVLPDPSVADGTITKKALLLLPGESAKRRVRSHSELQEVTHPTCVECKEYRNLTKNGFEQLQARHGMYAQVAVELPLFILGGRRVVVVGDALSWEESRITRQQPELLQTAVPAVSCSEVTRSQACEELSCNLEIEHCAYFPDRYSPECAECRPLVCSSYWSRFEESTGQTFCQAIGCDNPIRCRFDANRRLTELPSPEDCGDCLGGRRCSSITTQEEACQRLDCGVNFACIFSPAKIVSDPSECAKCNNQRCGHWTNEAEACELANCESQGRTCFFKAWSLKQPCAECRQLTCAPPNGVCPVGRVWSGQPRCTCCQYQDCSRRNDSQTGERFVFDARVCGCIRIPDDSTGDS